jgi:hypothetical protein
MSSPWKKQPEDVVDCVLKRAEVSKVRSAMRHHLPLLLLLALHLPLQLLEGLPK